MPWKCKKGCEIQEVCVVKVSRSVQDWSYNVNDRELYESTDIDTIEQDIESEDPPVCTICGELVYWEEAVWGDNKDKISL